MNKERRAALDKAFALIEEALVIVETAKDEETDYRENMPESMQNGEKGENADTAISALEDAVSQLEEARDNIENAKSN